VLNSEVNGSADNNYDDWRGLVADDATSARFEGNFVHDVRIGGVFIGPDDIEIVGNTFDHVRQDSMKIGANTGILIENNFGARNMHPESEDHPDFIQGQAASSDVVIRGNVALAGNTGNFQGIFLADAEYQNVLIEQNIIYNDMIRGINVDAGDNITIRENSLFTVPPSEGGSNKATKITMGDVTNTTVENNVMSSFQSDAEVTDSRVILQYEDPNDIAYYNDFFANPMQGLGVTLEDLRPADGTPVEFGSGMGAEQRLAELLDGSDDTTTDDSVTAGDDNLEVLEDESLTFEAQELLSNDSDDDGDSLTIESIGQPGNGSLTDNGDGTYTYTPDADFSGSDSFTYTVVDGNGGEDQATVTVDVEGTPDAPNATDDSANVRTDGTVTLDVLANDSDPDGDPIHIDGFEQPANGSVVENSDGTLTYTPDAGYTGSDSFNYTIADGTGRSDTATVSIEVSDLAAPTFEQHSLTFDGATASAEIVEHDSAYELENGTLELAFTADSVSGRQGLFSKDSKDFDDGGHLTVLVEDGDLLARLQSGSQTHTLSVSNAVTAGQAHHAALTFGEQGMKLYLDGELAGESSYTGGMAANAEPIVIGANQWASGDEVADELEHPFDGEIATTALYDEALSADDIATLAGGDSDDGGSTNTAPVAEDDSTTTDAGSAVTLDVLDNDSDADGDSLTVTDLGNPANGTAVLNDDGTVTYTPDDGFAGDDAFAYTVADGNGGSDTANVAVTVNDTTDSPSDQVTVSSASGLMDALNSASGGETIVLDKGSYGTVDLNDFQFSDFVTIKSADPLGAEFSAINVERSSHIRVDGVHVANSGNGSPGDAFVDIRDHSEHIEFINSEVNGSVDDQYVGAYGIRVDGGSRFVTVENNNVHDVEHGAVFFGVTDLNVIGNDFDFVGSDSMKYGNVTNALIENNSGAATTVPEAEDHIDFIQFQGDGDNVTLRGNTLLLKDSDNKVHQGIFLKDGDFNDILIEDNLIYTNTVNGIYVSSGHDVEGGTGGNVSVRAGERIAISPSGVPYGDVTPERVAVVDGSGDVVAGENPSSELPMHLAVYRRRDDVGAVVHAHSPYASTFASLDRPIPPSHYLLAYAGGEVPVAGYAPPGSAELGDLAAAALGDDRDVCLLRNHGVVAHGDDGPAALETAEMVEFCARVHYQADCIGDPVVLDDDAVAGLVESFSAYRGRDDD
jgi:ribulose-5-phosphate 4-epimerase/fuculose-1-phosphate aldolase